MSKDHHLAEEKLLYRSTGDVWRNLCKAAGADYIYYIAFLHLQHALLLNLPCPHLHIAPTNPPCTAYPHLFTGPLPSGQEGSWVRILSFDFSIQHNYLPEPTRETDASYSLVYLDPGCPGLILPRVSRSWTSWPQTVYVGSIISGNITQSTGATPQGTAHFCSPC